MAAETNIGVVHICHTADSDIEGFRDKPVVYQWQLIKMPTAALIRSKLVIQDRLTNPHRFEPFLNVAQGNQAKVLVQLANQDRLNLALRRRFEPPLHQVVEHDQQQWQYLDELVGEALGNWDELPREQRDFGLTKAQFQAGVGYKRIGENNHEHRKIP